MFLTFSSLLPLLFISIERFIKKDSLILIAVSSFILLCSSYYLFWSVSVFLLIYWPIRFFLTNELNKNTFTKFIIDSFKAIGIYLLGALLYAPILFPTVSFMLSNNRVTSDVAIDLFWNKETYLDIFIKAISPPFYVNTEINNYFGTQYYRTDQIALYTSVLTVILLPQIFAIKQNKTKILLMIFYGICFLLLLFEPGGSLMHGFSESSFRWTNFIILVNLIVCAHLLQNKSFNKLILLLTLFAVFFGVSIVFAIVKNPFQYFNQTIIVLISLVLMIIYSSILIMINKPVIPIIILVLAEIAFTGKITINSYIEKNS